MRNDLLGTLRAGMATDVHLLAQLHARHLLERRKLPTDHRAVRILRRSVHLLRASLLQAGVDRASQQPGQIPHVLLRHAAERSGQ